MATRAKGKTIICPSNRYFLCNYPICEFVKFRRAVQKRIFADILNPDYFKYVVSPKFWRW